MKKLLLIVTAIAGFSVLSQQAADARPRPDRSRRAYVIVQGRPVYRTVYFDAYDRCYTYYGPRRVYVSEYYSEYPRYYRPRRVYAYPPVYPVYPAPGVSFSFGFRG